MSGSSSGPARYSSAKGPHVVLLRHGETDWSRTGRHTGRSDIPLTDAGREGARRLRAALEEEYPQGPAAVLASPLSRAWDTAELAGLKAEKEPDLMEWDYGDVEGISTAQWREDHGDPGWSVWRHGAPGGETLEQVGERQDRVLRRVEGLLEDDRPVVLVAHGHSLRVFAARWLGLEPGAGAALRLDPTALSILGFEHGWRALLRWNAPVH